MSETTSAPAAPAPGPSDVATGTAPPPSSQTPLSISEAGRLLRQQRQQANGAQAADAAPESTPRRQLSPNDAIAAAAAKAAQPPAPAPAPKAPGGLSAMEKALGVPGVSTPEGTPPLPQITTPTDGAFAAIEIEGQQLRTAEEVRDFARRKTADYTQKTQEIAQQRQQLQQQQAALATVLPYIQPELARLAEQLQRAETVQRPDPALIDIDPNRYHRERAMYEQAMEEHQRLANLTTLQQQAHSRAMEQQVAQANEILAKEFSFWADPQERLQAQQQIVDWAVNKGGFTREELRGLSDHRYLKTMMKAALFDRWVEGAKTSAPPQQLAAPPRGAPPPPPPTARLADAEARFDSKPDWRSAAALLGARRANQQR